MTQSIKKSINGSCLYSAVITREQFLFYEVRTTAKLIASGYDANEAVEQIVKDNLFQYPTEKSVRRMAHACIRRLSALENPELVTAIASQPSEESKQICLYAMMKQYRLVWDFMITVIGSKYQNCDMSFGRSDINAFFMRLQEQDDRVASWSDSTIKKIKQVLLKVLIDNEYIDSANADRLNPVLICSALENAIRDRGDTKALSAFNCFS